MSDEESIKGEARGSCLCGGVRYRIAGEMRQILACHCGQCRKQTGSYMTSLRTDGDCFTLEDPEGLLAWYRASEEARRGFCRRCGSTLFWQRYPEGGEAEAGISIAAGGLDMHPEALKIARHIFVSDKADWFHLPPDAPLRDA